MAATSGNWKEDEGYIFLAWEELEERERQAKEVWRQFCDNAMMTPAAYTRWNPNTSQMEAFKHDDDQKASRP